MKFKIRPRLFGGLFIPPTVFMFIISEYYNNEFVFILAIVMLIVAVFFSDFIYDYFLLEYQSESFRFAGAKAIEFGYNPLVENKFEEIDISELSISEVYNKFSDKVTDKPEINTCGYMFTVYKRGTKSNKVEFYEYITPGIMNIYEYKFSRIRVFDYLEEKQIEIDRIKKNKRFVALNPR